MIVLLLVFSDRQTDLYSLLMGVLRQTDRQTDKPVLAYEGFLSDRHTDKPIFAVDWFTHKDIQTDKPVLAVNGFPQTDEEISVHMRERLRPVRMRDLHHRHGYLTDGATCSSYTCSLWWWRNYKH